jgi:hypothetical protein
VIRIFRAVVVFVPLLLVACLSQNSAPGSAPTNLTVTPGENRVVLSWDNVPGLTYWVYYKAGSSVSTEDHDFIGKGYSSPAIITGLANGTQYAFIVNASDNGSKTGPATPVVTATPRLLSPSVTWTVGTPLSSNSLNSIVFNTVNYVAVGDAATVLTAPVSYTSSGGVTAWSAVTTLPIGAGTNLISVLYDGAQFIALGNDGSIVISANLVDWIARSAIIGAPTMHALAYQAGPVYIAVGDGGAIYRNTTGGMTSAWTTESSGTVQNLYGVSYVNGLFVAVGAAGTLLTSPDGLTWTAQTSNTNNALRHVSYGVTSAGVGTYVAVGDAGTIVSSTDATTWTAQTIPTTQSFYSVSFGPDLQFIAVGTAGTQAYSSTGTDGSWSVGNTGSIDLNSIAPGDVTIAVGAAGTNVSGK